MNKPYETGAITEQGDLGLGFTPDEEGILEENAKEKKKNSRLFQDSSFLMKKYLERQK